MTRSRDTDHEHQANLDLSFRRYQRRPSKTVPDLDVRNLLLLAVLLLLGAITILIHLKPVSPIHTTEAIVVVAGGFVPIYWRNKRPIVVFLICGTFSELALLFSSPLPPIMAFSGLIALYSVVVGCSRRTSLNAGVVAIGGVLCVALVHHNALRAPAEFVFPIIVVAAVWLIGDNVQVRRKYIIGLEDRATRLELEQELKAQRAVSHERARIARELHDFVAHHVSVIAIQAGAARVNRGVFSNQGDAENADSVFDVLATIERVSKKALSELRTVIGVLRDSDGQSVDKAPDLAPLPNLSDVPCLLEDMAQVGLTVLLHVDGPPLDCVVVDEQIGLSLYRIIQESLTNVLKHSGPGECNLEVSYPSPDQIEIRVTNPLAEPVAISRRREGHGLVGMKERVVLFGGTFSAGQTKRQTFEVLTRMPVRIAEQDK